MAADIASLMQALGYERFAVVGHDRGAYVAHRLAAEHPQVTGLVIMDAIPIGEALARCDARFASLWWHWFFLVQTDKPAEDLINRDPDSWYKVTPRHMGREAFDDLRRALHDPEVVHAMCEDYRAGLTVDRAADDADKQSGRFITCPTYIIWSTRDDMEDLYGDPIAVWRDWASDVRGGGRIDCGHHIAEEAPMELADCLTDFLSESVTRT
jgi:haloacetate dehalogenase